MADGSVKRVSQTININVYWDVSDSHGNTVVDMSAIQ
jgi:hypothetical protein